MSGIPLQSGIIYGPVLSRRLGRSLGINLLPINQKVCSFNCVYCQYGYTTILTTMASEEILPTTSDVIAAVEKAIKKPRTIEYLTFSGNGESTIHPDFPEIVKGVKSLKDRYQKDAKLAILSNSSRVVDGDVLAALRLMDAPMMKLDAGDEETFCAINDPAGSIKFREIVEGLKSIPNLMIQSMLIDGKLSNIRGEAYDAWVACLGEMNPGKIYLYSIDRPSADDSVKCVPPERLRYIEKDLRMRFGLDAEAFW